MGVAELNETPRVSARGVLLFRRQLIGRALLCLRLRQRRAGAALAKFGRAKSMALRARREGNRYAIRRR